MRIRTIEGGGSPSLPITHGGSRTGLRRRTVRWCVAAMFLWLAALPAGLAAGEAPTIIEVSEFQVSYGGVDDPEHALSGGHPGLPSGSDLLAIRIRLGKGPEAYVAASAGVEAVVLPLADLPKQHTLFTTEALLSLQKQVVEWFHRRGLVGIFVAAHPEDLRGVEDMRAPDQKALRLVVWTGVVTSVRTVAGGDRDIPPEERVGNPRHKRILAGSPVRPYAEGDATRLDLLRKQALERYVYRLSRHPGRRVDLSLASDVRPGGVALDYLVNENRPWYAYVQASNTGTKFTSDWRERVGFVHNQLTNNDDIFTLDYITASFEA
ncbi:hypothetical protein HQ560_17405, partial [bacterium]|nr:hypothetical protein [bacterium]